MQVVNQNGSVHYQYYDTRVETTQYINARTGESTGGSTVTPPSTLSFVSDYYIGTLSGKVGRAWEVFKNNFNNLVSEQHEGVQPGGGIMFTSSMGEGTDRGPKRTFVDAKPENIDLLVSTIGQLKTTAEAGRINDVLDVIEKFVGSLETGRNVHDLIEKMKDDLEKNTKPSPVTQTILAPARGVIRDSETKKLKEYDVSTVERIELYNNKIPDTIRTIKYKKPKK